MHSGCDEYDGLLLLSFAGVLALIFCIFSDCEQVNIALFGSSSEDLVLKVYPAVDELV